MYSISNVYVECVIVNLCRQIYWLVNYRHGSGMGKFEVMFHFDRYVWRILFVLSLWIVELGQTKLDAFGLIGEYTFDGTMNKPKITFGKIQLNIKKDEPVSTSPPEDAEPISGKHCYSNICIFVVLTFFTYEMNALIRMNLQQVLEHLERIKIHWIMLLKSLLTIWKANVLKILWASRSSGAKPKHSILPYDSPFIGEIFFRL